MFPSRWLRNVLGTVHCRKALRRLTARGRKPVRLMLESLEERLTPSGGQTAGSYNAITAAIAADTASNTNYVIQITNSFTFDSGGQVSVSHLGTGSTLTLEGQNGNNFTLTGNGNRLFTVASGQNVTFADLTLTGGTITNTTNNTNGATGGAILDSGGNVALGKAVIEGNTVTGAVSASGGGVFVSGVGSLTVAHSAIKNNLAQGSKGPTGFGGGSASGGGVSVTGGSTVLIRDSIISDNSARGYRGADGTTQGTANGRDARNGGSAYGGGLFVGGGAWTVTLIGDTLSGNTAVGGDGGDGAAGPNATGSNAQGGRGGNGGWGGDALGGGAFFSFSNPVHDPGPGGVVPPYPSGHLTILNGQGAPTAYPSLMIDNSVQAGNGGKGAAGGTSTGTANNADGGQGGQAGLAGGGGGYVSTALVGNTFTADIGNSTFYGNTVSGGNGGVGGAAGTGGSGAAGTPGNNQASGFTAGGGVGISLAGGGSLAMVNSTVANNTLTAGLNSDGTRGSAEGGGLYDTGSVGNNTGTFDNNTITQNTLIGLKSAGFGVSVEYGSPSLFNNLIQGNRSLGSSATELFSRTTLNNASNNFIGSMSPNALDTSTNIVGNSQMQLGGVVGVDANGNPTGGAIYYPLLPGVVSIGAGTTSVLNTIAAVEGTTAAHATDEIGDPLSTNGTISLGAVQIPTPPPSPLPPPPPSQPALTPPQLMAAIILDMDALMFQDFPPILSLLNAISERIVGQPLPPTADLIPTIQGDFAALVATLIRDM